MTEPSLAQILDAMQTDAGAMTADVPPSWMQGRTAYGGFTAALLLGAVERLHPGLPPLRSALVNFTGPVGAPPRITAELLRRGRNVTTIAARAEIDGATAALATFTFGAARESHVRFDRPAPPATPPEETPPFIPPEAQALAPVFHRNYDFRLIDGHRPFTGADRGYMRAWIRHVDPASRSGAASVLSIADMLPPAAYPMMTERGPNSSMTWICNFLDDDLSTTDGWWQVESDLSATRDGYGSQVMRAWNADGALVIDGMQSVAVFV